MSVTPGAHYNRALLNEDNEIKVAILDQGLERLVSDSIQNTKQGIIAVLPPEVAQKRSRRSGRGHQRDVYRGFSPVLLTSPNIRLAFRRMIAPSLPKVAVISFNELIPNVEIESIKTVRMPDEN